MKELNFPSKTEDHITPTTSGVHSSGVDSNDLEAHTLGEMRTTTPSEFSHSSSISAIDPKESANGISSSIPSNRDNEKSDGQSSMTSTTNGITSDDATPSELGNGSPISTIGPKESASGISSSISSNISAMLTLAFHIFIIVKLR